MRYLIALALALVVGACAAPAAGGSTGAASPSPLPSIAVSPPAAADPCKQGLSHLAGFTSRLASNLGTIRPLVVGRQFDSPHTANANAQVATTILSYRHVGLVAALEACPSSQELSAATGDLMKKAESILSSLHGASIQSGETQRATAAALYALLPDVLALSDGGASVAAGLGLPTGDEIALGYEPLGALSPLPTPTPVPTPTPKPTPVPMPMPRPAPKPPAVVAIGKSFFGSGVGISTYKVTGSSPSAIVASIRAHGPYNNWLNGRAEALTKSRTTNRFHYETDYYNGCRIVVERSPAIVTSYTIVLPRWAAPAGVSASTVQWWNSDIRATATHEKVHVSNGRAATKRMNTALSKSTCATANHNLAAVYRDWQRTDCEFDMKEYGAAEGLSLTACLAQ